MTTTTDPRAAYTAGLRALADLLDTDPDLPLPSNGGTNDVSRLAWYLFAGLSHEQQKAAAADLVRRIPGRFDKYETGDLFRFRGQIHGLLLEVIVDRPAVCERVVTGTREVTREVPDPEALAQVPTTTVTETVEDVEWVCAPLLVPAEAVSAWS